MALPFVRDLFADVESLPAFSRVASHLKEGTGRISVSGLAPTAKALLSGSAAKSGRAAQCPGGHRQSRRRRSGSGAAGLSPSSCGGADPRLHCQPAGARRSAVSESLPAPGDPGGASAPRCGRSRPAQSRSSSRRSPPPPCVCVPPSTTPTWRATLRRGDTLDTDSLLAHLNTVGYMRRGRRRNAR